MPDSTHVVVDEREGHAELEKRPHDVGVTQRDSHVRDIYPCQRGASDATNTDWSVEEYGDEQYVCRCRFVRDKKGVRLSCLCGKEK